MKTQLTWVLTVCIGLFLCSAVMSDDLQAEAEDHDSVVLTFADGRTLSFRADELSKVSLLLGQASQEAQLAKPVTHLLMPLNAKSVETPEESQSKWVKIRQDDIDSPEWQEAIRKAEKIARRGSRYTLLRVNLPDGAPSDVIQLRGGQLEKLSAGGINGGAFCACRSGEFIVMTHNGSGRKKRTPLKVAAMDYGQGTVWVDIPERRTLGVLGDIEIDWPDAKDRGRLLIDVLPNDFKQARSLVISPLVVGGNYGERVPFEDGQCEVTELPAGSYKLLLPDYDIVKSRWDVRIAPGMTTRLQFRVTGEDQIAKVTESFERQAAE